MASEADTWDDNSLAPRDSNDPYMDRVMNNNQRVTKLVDEGAAREIERLKNEVEKLDKARRESEYARKRSMEEFNKDKKMIEDKYQEAITENNRLKFRENDRYEAMEKQIQSLKEDAVEYKREIKALRFNIERFEVYLENEDKQDIKIAGQQEEKAKQELLKLEQAHQHTLQQAQNRVAEAKKQTVKKEQDARKRMELLVRVRTSTTRHNGLLSNSAANVSPSGPNGHVQHEDGDDDLHEPLPAFDDGMAAGGSFDLVPHPQQQRFCADQQRDLFGDHNLDGIHHKGGFDCGHDDEHSLEHTRITPSLTKGKRGENETGDDDSEEELSDDDEEMSEEPPAAKVPGKSGSKNTEKKKSVKRHRTVKTRKRRRQDVCKFRQKFKGMPIEKWSREALKSLCIYKKQKGDGAVPEKKADLLELCKVRSLRPSPPCSDSEDCDKEKKKEEKKKDKEQVECMDDDDDDDDDTEIEDESAAEEYKADKEAEEYTAGDDAEEYKSEEEEEMKMKLELSEALLGNVHLICCKEY